MPATSGVWDYTKAMQQRAHVKGRSIYADVGGRNLEVALVLANGEGGEMTEEDEANCRLLANAAALLDACSRAEAHFGWLLEKGALTREEEPVIELLRAAISDVEGG